MTESNVSLKSYNTFGIDANAALFSSFRTIDELDRLIRSNRDLPLLIMGGGSNILFTKDYNGLVLKNEIKGFEIVDENNDEVVIRSGAGEIWHEFVLKCIEKGFGGVENLSLIPGCVGASPMQNIGAYGVEIKDVFDSLEAYNIQSGEIRSFSKDECNFGYRESVFKRELKGQYIITRVSYRLSKHPKVNTTYGAIDAQLKSMGIQAPTIKDVSNAVIAIRSSKLPDPSEIGNAGSFFKNPVVTKDVLSAIEREYNDVPNYPAQDEKVKLAAGWLIEKAGWKGFTKDTYGVHKNQALVLVNYGQSKGVDIYELSEIIIQDIQKKFGITLEREVNII